MGLGRELLALQEELRGQTYWPGKYRELKIFRPKERLISAAPYRDRVVHHALCNVIEPLFDRTFIHDSYACRQGKGTHRAVDRLTGFCRRSRYALQCDVRKYFPSIDHEILLGLIFRIFSFSIRQSIIPFPGVSFFDKNFLIFPFPCRSLLHR